MATSIELGVLFRNGDSGEVAENVFKIEVGDDVTNATLEKVRNDTNGETLTELVIRLVGSDEQEKGIAYDELWRLFSNFAYNKLGWHDVMVSVQTVGINGENLEISEDDLYGVLSEDLEIQMVHGEHMMYLYNL